MGTLMSMVRPNWLIVASSFLAEMQPGESGSTSDDRRRIRQPLDSGSAGIHSRNSHATHHQAVHDNQRPNLASTVSIIK